MEPDPKNPKKAKISYKVEMNNAYTYDSIAYVRLRHRIDTLVQRNIGDRLLRDGDNFNVVQLEAERQRISSLLRNNGYYYFRPEFISYQADTIMNLHKARAATHRTAPLEDRRHIGIPERLQQRATDRFHPV